MAYIELKDVTRVYPGGNGGIRALDGVDLQVEKGELCIVVGPSGAGKTTVLNLLGGMDTPTSGSILVDGQEIAGLKGKKLTRYRRYDIGFVFQFYNLVGNLTALENVELASEICPNPMDAAEALTRVGLQDRMSNFPAQLSGGEQQRVAIARALANNPKVLLCDEPTSALDPLTTKSMLALLKDINTKLGVTIVIITHELAVVRSICNRMTVINASQFVETGNVDEIFNNPQSEITRMLLGFSQEKEA